MRRTAKIVVAAGTVALLAGCGAASGGSPAGHHPAAAAEATPSAVAQPSTAAPSSGGMSHTGSAGTGSGGASSAGAGGQASSSPSASPSVSHQAAPYTVAANTPTLRPGMRGPAVRQLQHRLAALRYYPGTADGRFGPDTQEAVWAFQEVQGLRTTGNVNRFMQEALAHPRQPHALVPRGGALRVEINLGRGYLVLYRGGHVALVSHISSGGGYYFCNPGGGCGYAVTPTGNYHTVTFMPGWVTVPLGEMYNPVFFIGHAYAIHGDTYVPLQPASHGCVRIPMDVAAFFHTLLPATGTPVYVRH